MKHGRVIHTPEDAMRYGEYLAGVELPVTISAVKGVKRTNPQHSTIHMWYAVIAQHLGDSTTEEVRAMCKLEMGVPILRRDDEAFAADYDAAFKPLPYEHKLRLFARLDPAITSRMTTSQLTEYMKTMLQRFAEQGFYLPDPDARTA